MAVNLINSSDIEVEQTGSNVQLKTSTPLSTIEGNIGDLTLLNTTDKSSVVNAVNEVNTKTEVFSTTETLTNKVWIDGKPIYRTVITGTTPNASVTSWTTLASLQNIDTAINIYGALESSTSKNFIPRYESSSFYFIISCEGSDIKYKQVGYNYRDYHLIFEYTKVS